MSLRIPGRNGDITVRPIGLFSSSSYMKSKSTSSLIFRRGGPCGPLFRVEHRRKEGMIRGWTVTHHGCASPYHERLKAYHTRWENTTRLYTNMHIITPFFWACEKIAIWATGRKDLTLPSLCPNDPMCCFNKVSSRVHITVRTLR